MLYFVQPIFGGTIVADYTRPSQLGSRGATPACWPWVMAFIGCFISYFLSSVLLYIVGVAGLFFVFFVGGPDPTFAGVIVGYFVVMTLVAVVVGGCLRALGVRRAFTAALAGGYGGAIAGFAAEGMSAVVGSMVEFVIIALIIKGAEPKSSAAPLRRAW